MVCFHLPPDVCTAIQSSQETVIVSEAENALAEPIADMRFSLPASPSVSVLLLLAAACAEVRRAGDHKIGRQLPKLFGFRAEHFGMEQFLCLGNLSRICSTNLILSLRPFRPLDC